MKMKWALKSPAKKDSDGNVVYRRGKGRRGIRVGGRRWEVEVLAMITRSNLAEQLREYQIRSKHDWASVSFFSSTSTASFSSSRYLFIFPLFSFTIFCFRSRVAICWFFLFFWGEKFISLMIYNCSIMKSPKIQLLTVRFLKKIFSFFSWIGSLEIINIWGIVKFVEPLVGLLTMKTWLHLIGHNFFLELFSGFQFRIVVIDVLTLERVWSTFDSEVLRSIWHEKVLETKLWWVQIGSSSTDYYYFHFNL